MEKITRYQDILIGYLQERAQLIPSNLPDIESWVIADRESGHFQLLQAGWQDYQYVFTVVFHFHLRDGKVWFMRNITEREVVDVLMERGIAQEDIVLGFRHPQGRAMAAAGSQ